MYRAALNAGCAALTGAGWCLLNTNQPITLSALYGGIMPAAASLPFQVSLVPEGGGASRPGCLATAITCYICAGSLVQGIPLLVDAAVVEVFEAAQGRGVNCGSSTGNSWLNNTNPSRPDWVTNTFAKTRNAELRSGHDLCFVRRAADRGQQRGDAGRGRRL